MKTVLPLIAATLAFAALALAQPAPPGRSLAATCANCHGTFGASDGDVPSIGGMSKEAIVARMRGFKSGSAPSTVMEQLAKGYTDEQIDAIATWFAAQRPAAR